MEPGDGGEEQVMSEVHLGCPPRFSGLYLSRFTFSSRPLGNDRSSRARTLPLLRRISSYTLPASPMSRGGKKVLYLTLEKRFNFSLDELDIVANGYKHFQSFFAVQDGLDNAALKLGFVGEQIDLARVPQHKSRDTARGFVAVGLYL